MNGDGDDDDDDDNADYYADGGDDFDFKHMCI